MNPLDRPGKHVKVVIRTRPTSEFANDIITFDSDNKGIHIHIPKNTDGGFINNQQEHWEFKYDNILHNCSQEKVYDECARPIMRSLLEGYNGTIMAYGQTGAGKTFTMTGATENYKHRGLIPRAISHIYREICEKPHIAYTIRISYIEIYNEQIVDLLAGLNETQVESLLSVVEDKNGSSVIKGVALHVANSEEEALNLLFEGETNRSISEHQLNKSSTRSHCIFTVHVESRSRVESTEKVIISKLNLVDLAGSERLSKTQTEGISLKEAMYINKSLTFLEQVIIALADKKREHIPYRQSKMTHVLRDSLGGNCNTLMIANIWGEKEHMEETISTLRFATRMMCVSNSPEVNVQFDPMALIKKYEREIKDLKQELAMHDTLSNRSHVQYEPYSESQRMELLKQVKTYIEDEENEPEVVSLRQIREFFKQFRIIYKSLESQCDEYSSAIKKNDGVSSTTERITRTDILDNENTKGNEQDKYEKVGDIELYGFGVGLAPGCVKMSSQNTSYSLNRNEKRKKNPRILSNLYLMDTRHVTDSDADEIQHEIKPVFFEHFQSSALPPLPSYQANVKGLSKKDIHQHVSRAQEFENFKNEKGLEISRILTENKALLKERKRLAQELVANINLIKTDIEKKKEGLSSLRNKAFEENLDAVHIYSHQEYVIFEAMKSLKKQYKEKYDILKHTRNDITYCTKLVDQCRQKLIYDFEQWYENIHGGPIAELEKGGNNEDVMDIGEKFDRLQIERMSQEDPDSLPYYNARKNTERRTIKLKR